LVAVIQAWPNLPEAIKVDIFEMRALIKPKLLATAGSDKTVICWDSAETIEHSG
jgi:hypothetical protein